MPNSSAQVLLLLTTRHHLMLLTWSLEWADHPDSEIECVGNRETSSDGAFQRNKKNNSPSGKLVFVSRPYQNSSTLFCCYSGNQLSSGQTNAIKNRSDSRRGRRLRNSAGSSQPRLRKKQVLSDWSREKFIPIYLLYIVELYVSSSFKACYFRRCPQSRA